MAQVLQTCLGLAIGAAFPPETPNDEKYEILVWTHPIHTLYQTILDWLSVLQPGLKLDLGPSSGNALSWASFKLVGGQQNMDIFLARLLYCALLPALRFYVALWLADTWVFFIHRAEHQNQWLYSEWVVIESVRVLTFPTRTLSCSSSRVVCTIQLGRYLRPPSRKLVPQRRSISTRCYGHRNVIPREHCVLRILISESLFGSQWLQDPLEPSGRLYNSGGRVPRQASPALGLQGMYCTAFTDMS